MTLDERATSVAYMPYGDFKSPQTLDARSLIHYIPIYLGSFRTWVDNTKRQDGPDRSGTEARTFDYYLRKAFERARELGLNNDPDFSKWHSRYWYERRRAREAHILEDLAA